MKSLVSVLGLLSLVLASPALAQSGGRYVYNGPPQYSQQVVTVPAGHGLTANLHVYGYATGWARLDCTGEQPGYAYPPYTLDVPMSHSNTTGQAQTVTLAASFSTGALYGHLTWMVTPPLLVVDATATSSLPANPPAMAIDGDASTSWAAAATGATLTVRLNRQARATTITVTLGAVNLNSTVTLSTGTSSQTITVDERVGEVITLSSSGFSQFSVTFSGLGQVSQVAVSEAP